MPVVMTLEGPRVAQQTGLLGIWGDWWDAAVNGLDAAWSSVFDPSDDARSSKSPLKIKAPQKPLRGLFGFDTTSIPTPVYFVGGVILGALIAYHRKR